MDNFTFMKQCLQEFEYPNLHGLTDEQIANIFNQSNRCFLISWLLKKFDPIYETEIGNTEDYEKLANLICDIGFCTKKEKLDFMTGKLPLEEQVTILYRMFCDIKDLSKKLPAQDFNPVSFDDISDLCNKNLNLFPMYGSISLASSDEEEIVENSSIILEDHENGIDEEQILQDLQNMKDHISDLKPILKNVLKDRKDDASVKKIPEGFDETLEKNCKNVQKVSDYVKNLRIINDFLSKSDEVKKTERAKGDLDDFGLLQMLIQEMKTVKC